MEQRDGEEPVELPVRDRAVNERERLEQRIVRLEDRGERHDDRDAQDRLGQSERAAATARAGEVAVRRAGLAHLLRQPAEAARDLRAILRRGSSVGFAIRVARRGQLAGPHPRARDLAPGPVGARCLRQLHDRLPGAERLGLVIHPEERVAGPEPGFGGHRRVVEPEDPAVIGQGLGRLAGFEVIAGAVEQAPRGRGRQGSLGGPGRIEVGRIHRGGRY